MNIKLSSNNILSYLSSLEHCHSLDVESITIENHRTFLIELISDVKIVVKQESYYYRNDKMYCSDCHLLAGEFRLYQTLLTTLELPYYNIYFDSKNIILSYEYPKNLVSFKKIFSTKNNTKNFKSSCLFISKLIGDVLATIHSNSFRNKFGYEAINKQLGHQFPYLMYFQDKICPELFFTMPPDSYKFFQIFQFSETLKTSIKKLIAQVKPYCLIHNNLNFCNILIPEDYEFLLSQSEDFEESRKDLIKFINWEYCSWGDPAFDLGTTISGYLLLWINSLIVHPDIKLETSLQLALTPLEQVQPLIVALTKAYLNTWTEILDDYPNFLDRVVQFSGLALIYHIIEMINSFRGFNNQSICILQVAKKLVCQPEISFKSVFGLTQAEFLSYSNLK